VDDRDRVLAALPQSKGGERPRPTAEVVLEQGADLWQTFCAMLEFHKGEVADIGVLAGFRDRATWDDDADEAVGAVLGQRVASVWDAECGVTHCDAAIAETGSIFISAAPVRRRLTSLAPPVHGCLVRQSNLVLSLEEGLSRLAGRNSVLVTGPSRTADVEGVIVMGVHGPKRLIVVPLPG